MRNALTALCAFACIASCAARPKSVAPAAAPPAVRPAASTTLRLKAEGPSVAYAAPEGWQAPADDGAQSGAVLTRPDRADEAAAILIKPTGLDDKVEEVTTGWAMTAVTLKFFAITDISQPTYPSDEEGDFTISGVDDAKRPMVMLCRIRHVGAPTADFWAIILLVGPTSDAPGLSANLDRITNSLHIEASTPPK